MVAPPDGWYWQSEEPVDRADQQHERRVQDTAARFHNFECQHGYLVDDTLRNAQQMQSD